MMNSFLKKSKSWALLGLFFVSLNSLNSCQSASYHNTRIDGKFIPIEASLPEDQSFTDYIAPYKKHIDEDLSKVLSYAPETMDKSKGKWQTTIGNLFAEATLEMVNPVFEKRTGHRIDACMLNQGGIRSIISEGDVTTRTAFEVMPFENSSIVLQLKGKEILELAQYMIAERLPHPLANIQIFITKNQEIQKVLIAGKEVDPQATYFVVTNDYLALGGDRMDFFKKATQSFVMDYKLRNVLLDYFKKHPKLPIITTQHVIEL